MHLHMSLRHTVQVVGTEDLTRQRHTVLTFTSERLYKLYAIQQHIDITTDEGLYVACCATDSVLLSKATTKYITMNSAGIKVNIRSLIGIEFHWITTRLAGAGITQCRTAIDISVDSCTSSDILSFCSHIYCYVTIYQCRFTLTATEDNIGYICSCCRCCTYSTSGNINIGVTFQHTIDIGTTINSLLDRTALHCDSHVAKVLGSN